MTETRATFVVRLWREPDAKPGEWRGEAEYVQSERVFRFTDPAAMLKFIQERLAELENAEPKPASGGGGKDEQS